MKPNTLGSLKSVFTLQMIPSICSYIHYIQYIYIIYTYYIYIYYCIYIIYILYYISSHIQESSPGPRTAPSPAPPLGAMEVEGWPRWCPGHNDERKLGEGVAKTVAKTWLKLWWNYLWVLILGVDWMIYWYLLWFIEMFIANPMHVELWHRVVWVWDTAVNPLAYHRKKVGINNSSTNWTWGNIKVTTRRYANQPIMGIESAKMIICHGFATHHLALDTCWVIEMIMNIARNSFWGRPCYY